MPERQDENAVICVGDTQVGKGFKFTDLELAVINELIRQFVNKTADDWDKLDVLGKALTKEISNSPDPQFRCSELQRFLDQLYLAAEFAEIAEIPAHQNGFPRIWDLSTYIFPPQFRARVLVPYQQELLAGYLQSRAKYRSRGARTWLKLCYSWWTACMMFQGLCVFAKENLGKLLALCIPEVLRRFLS